MNIQIDLGLFQTVLVWHPFLYFYGLRFLCKLWSWNVLSPHSNLYSVFSYAYDHAQYAESHCLQLCLFTFQCRIAGKLYDMHSKKDMSYFTTRHFVSIDFNRSAGKCIFCISFLHLKNFFPLLESPIPWVNAWSLIHVQICLHKACKTL